MSNATSNSRSLEAPQVWSCFTRGEETESEVRYVDILGIKYAYDANVPNHTNVRRGDALVLRDDVTLFGYGLVTHVIEGLSTKQMELCRSCGRSGLAKRSKLRPAYRCNRCKAEFDEPIFEEREVAIFEAWYEATWAPFGAPPARNELLDLYVGRDQQNAIRRLKAAEAVLWLQGHATLEGLVELRERVEAGENPKGGWTPAVGKRRVGQQAFKLALLERFGVACAISGPQPREVLDAAHLYRFADDPQHHLDGGLLFRADLHRLFDSFLLTINPSTWVLELAPDLRQFAALAPLHGAPLALAVSLRPSAEFLEIHCAEAKRRWGL